MSKMMKVLLAVSVAGISSVSFAATSGVSGTSGSAGLGIDTAALTVVSGGANPKISDTESEPGTGSPVDGVAAFFTDKEEGSK